MASPAERLSDHPTETESDDRRWKRKHLVGLEQLSREEIEMVLDTAPQFLAVQQRESGMKKVPLLQGRLVVNLFLEPSTRTRVSFELAAKRLKLNQRSYPLRTDLFDPPVLKGQQMRLL